MNFTRRDLGKLALSALSASRLLAKPNSIFGGVQIGIIISPTNFRDIPLAADEVLQNLVQAGISAVEMQDVRMEAYAGAPVPPRAAGGRAPLTPEQIEARRKAAEALTRWRLSAPMEKYKVLRMMYQDSGVKIYAFRMGANLSNALSDAEIEYYFQAAETLGADQITVELPTDPALSRRMGGLAARHKIMMGYHNHTQVNEHSWDTAFAQSKYNGANFDVGHYVAATSQSPIPFIQQHHDRITCLHLKDRKLGTNGGENVPWGQGDTPLKEILLLMKREKYKFPAGIELEYRIPEGSTTMAEIGKCLQFCKNALA